MRKIVRAIEDLEVWQRAMDLAEAVYEVIRKLPSEERFALGVQLRKAAVSVPSNIAEGYGRRSPGDYRRFLCIASSSNREIHTQLLLAARTGLVARQDVTKALDLSRRASEMLTKLIQSIQE